MKCNEKRRKKRTNQREQLKGRYPMRRSEQEENKTERKPRSKETWGVRLEPQLWRPKCETKYMY